MKLAKITKSVLLSIFLLCYAGNLYSQQIAFPGAEGYGKFAKGGRCGRVIAVTNLNDSGPGSLREAIDAEGPRIVVFRVSGTIPLSSSLKIRHPNITIAGQTAPGDGICIKGSLGIDAEDVVVRYIRVRTNERGDAVSAGHGRSRIILDHVSASWSTDEVMSIYQNSHVTIQYCMITEPTGNGKSHKFGGIWGNNYSTYHHNLIAHSDSRNPRWASGSQFSDYRNNVLYNWGYQSSYGGEPEQRGRPQYNFTTVNMVANYYKPGPATRSNARGRIVQPSDGGSWYVADNVVVGSPEVTADNWKGVVDGNFTRLDQPWDAMPFNQQSPEDAYQAVLEHAGCSLPNRDAIDARIIDEVRTGTAKYGENGIIAEPNDVGGWLELKSAPAPADSDHDGMPDEWEVRFGLNPQDATDGSQDKDNDGYTNVEECLNGTDPTVFVDYTKPENNVNTLK